MASSPELHRTLTAPSSANLAVLRPVPAVHVRFGPYEFDMKAGELCRGDEKIVLPDQPLQILLLLVERPGEVVTRDEIQARLWPGDVIVSFEVSINQAIRKLRRILDDAADEPKYVETVGRRGYRLKVPVSVESGPHPCRRESDLTWDRRGPERRDSKVIVYRPEDLEAIAAQLAKLLQALAAMHSPTAERRQGELCPSSVRLVRYRR